MLKWSFLVGFCLAELALLTDRLTDVYSYFWPSGTVLAFRWSCNNDEALDQKLRALSTSRIRIAASDLIQEGFTYEVVLSVVDFVGTESAEAVKEVFRSSLALPAIGIAQPSYSLVEYGKALYLQGSVEFSACAGNEEIVMSWEVEAFDLNGNVKATTGEDFQSAGRTFAASALQAATVYKLTLNGYPASQPFNIGSANVNVEVLRPELRVAITGGSRKVSSLRPLEVVSSVLTGESIENFNFEWECSSDLAGGSCRSKVTNELLVFDKSPTVAIEADILPEGSYRFSVVAQDNPSLTDRIRHAQASADIIVVDFVLPEVSIAIDTVATPIPTSGKINSDTKIAITSVVQPLAPSQVGSPMVLRWTTSADLPLDTDTSIAPLGTNGANFVLNANVLLPGAAVTFSLEVTVFDDVLQESVTGLATVEVKVNFPPSSGTCAVEPQSGLALQTQFGVVCSGWKDDTSTDLFYEYIALVPVSEGEPPPSPPPQPPLCW